MVRLESKRLVLRDHEPEDLEPYCEMESDQVHRAHQPVHPREELERSFKNSALPRKEMGLLATVFKDDGRYIGRTTTSYSLRSALTGSTRNAASAGTMLAMPAIASNTVAAAPKAIRSKALTP